MIEMQDGPIHRRSADPREAEGERHDALAVLAEERMAYRDRLPELVRAHEGQFVLIKGQNVIGVFGDHAEALRQGYRRFGIVPFLVRQIAASEPMVSLPNGFYERINFY